MLTIRQGPTRQGQALFQIFRHIIALYRPIACLGPDDVPLPFIILPYGRLLDAYDGFFESSWGLPT